MNGFQEKLKLKMDEYVHFVYKITRKFPKEEIYGCTSQLRRSSLSVILNYIEGFARRRKAVKINFWEISYDSLAESKYLIKFRLEENFINESDYDIAHNLSEEIGAMLYRLLLSLEN